MSIDHVQHHCECDHSDVKYCRTCRVAYCQRCGKEWRDASTWTPTWTYSNVLGYGQTGQLRYPEGAVLCRHDG